jgi:hypothetical protein
VPLPSLTLPSIPALPVPISPQVARIALIAARGSVTGLWLAPAKLSAIAGLSDKSRPGNPLVLRWFAVREAALAALLATAAPEQQALQLSIGIALDATDTVAAVLAVKNRELPLRGALLGVAGAAGAVALGVIALSGSKRA